MAKKSTVIRKQPNKLGKKAAPQKKSAPKKKAASPQKKAARPTKVVFDGWDSYIGTRDGVTMSISFDDAVTGERPPANLSYCARVWIPIRSPNASGGPISPEKERLWKMEDALCSMLQKHRVRCRLVARLTYDGLRELVFQLRDWNSFRTPVGLWMAKHKDYEIDVSEHDGWEFFDDYIRPRTEDRLFMADRDVINSLIESGSDPQKEHSLEYAFLGPPNGLKRVATTLLKRGYHAFGELDYSTGMVELVKRLVLDPAAVVEESISNQKLADKSGVEFAGWGATVVD